MERVNARQRRQLCLGLGFLAPSILGFLAFIIIPLGFSLLMAFSNWDLRLHNMFKSEPLRFIWFGNFTRLIEQPDFWRFLGNTLFLMLGIPFAIAGSLLLALALSKDLGGGRGRARNLWIVAAALLASVTWLTALGAGATGMVLVLLGLGAAILIAGSCGGTTVYRTLLYLPSFTSGVAVFILWRKLYNPQTGPINQALAPLLDQLAAGVNAVPAGWVRGAGWLCWAGGGLLAVWTMRQVWRSRRDGDWGWGMASLFLFVMAMVGGALFGLGDVLRHLPAMAADGLQPPNWLSDYHWAKPAIMIMAFWGAIGSNNMLLYLAGLSNVPPELYEAADMDGASGWQKFWHVTWPQLAPVTFFIVIMSVIGGLQGGFEMARTMTQGGPAGATTTLSYFIYTEGFETGRLGYSSAVAWTLFVMVLVVTLFNWKFGSRNDNE